MSPARCSNRTLPPISSVRRLSSGMKSAVCMRGIPPLVPCVKPVTLVPIAESCNPPPTLREPVACQAAAPPPPRPTARYGGGQKPTLVLGIPPSLPDERSSVPRLADQKKPAGAIRARPLPPNHRRDHGWRPTAGRAKKKARRRSGRSSKAAGAPVIEGGRTAPRSGLSCRTTLVREKD